MPFPNWPERLPSRREVLQRAGLGIGWLALLDLLRDDGLASPAEPTVRSRIGQAKSVIFLFMGGGPSQVDTFDPKPLLGKLHGQAVPESIAQDVPRIARSPLVNLLASPFKFQRCGESGIPVADIYPHVGGMIDDICVLRGCRHDSPIHAPAEYLSTTGSLVGDRPSLGAWLTYGLGSENRNLPSFVVMTSRGSSGRPPGWQAGFLPARFQGTVVSGETVAVPNIEMPPNISVSTRRAQLDLIDRLNRKHQGRLQENSELEARIESYELAFRMQTAAPEAFDLASETQETLTLYGVDEKETQEFGTHCLLARRLVERGVRFIQLRSGNWDAHSKIKKNHGEGARQTDRPIAGLLRDLKRRGLLEQTLVIWGGEFGRTPTAEGSGPDVGRDHSPSGYSMWLAGGGVRGGQILGATDPVGYAAIDEPVHPNDLHATILHAFGIDQRDLFYTHHSRREIVTVNGGRVIDKVFG
jgi:hypothetical protein